jgi:hypothetical protein
MSNATALYRLSQGFNGSIKGDAISELKQVAGQVE